MSHFSATLNSTADAFCDSWVSSTSHSQRKKSRRALFWRIRITKQSTKDSTNTGGNSKTVLRRQPIRRLTLKKAKRAHAQARTSNQASIIARVNKSREHWRTEQVSHHHTSHALPLTDQPAMLAALRAKPLVQQRKRSGEAQQCPRRIA